MDFDELCRRTREVARDLASADACHVTRVDVVNLAAQDCSGDYLPWRQVVRLDQSSARHIDDLLRGRLQVGNLENALDAIASLHHEHIHALGPRDRGARHGVGLIHDAESKGLRGPRAIEEAVTESWNETKIHEFVERVELSRQVPELLRAKFVSKYSIECAILRPVTEGLARLGNSSEVEVLRIMASETPDTRARRLGRRVSQQRGWAGQIWAAGAENAIAQLFDSFMDRKLIFEGAPHGRDAINRMESEIQRFEGR